MGHLTTKIINLDQLCTKQIAYWQKFRASNKQLYSPYFGIAYVQIINKICKNVHILVVEENQNPIAFLAFQAKIANSGRIGYARPIGAPMTDYQGFICAPDTDFDVHQVLKQAGFGAYHFSALIDNGNLLKNYGGKDIPCTVLDISNGAENWRSEQGSSYRRHLKNLRRHIRNTEEFGERRFDFCSRSETAFNQLIQWKREQFKRTGKYDILSVKWTQELLQRLWQRGPDADLRADLHVLYFGDKIAALDLGLCDGETFHSWMVAYNPDVRRVSPGIQLLEALIDECDKTGYKRLDLGEGIDGYKRHYATEDIHVRSGFIAANGPAAALSKLYGNMEDFSEEKLGKMGRLPGKLRRRYSQIAACDQSLAGRSKAMLQAIVKAR